MAASWELRGLGLWLQPQDATRDPVSIMPQQGLVWEVQIMIAQRGTGQFLEPGPELGEQLLLPGAALASFL